MEQIKAATLMNISLISDRTSLTKKQRAEILSEVPDNYYKIAVNFNNPSTDDQVQDWIKRLDSRPGKIIPKSALEWMRDSFIEPTAEEGFDGVVDVAYILG